MKHRVESAYKDIPSRAPSMVSLNIFAVFVEIVVQDIHVVLILLFKLLSLFTFILLAASE